MRTNQHGLTSLQFHKIRKRFWNRAKNRAAYLLASRLVNDDDAHPHVYSKKSIATRTTDFLSLHPIPIGTVAKLVEGEWRLYHLTRWQIIEETDHIVQIVMTQLWEQAKPGQDDGVYWTIIARRLVDLFRRQRKGVDRAFAPRETRFTEPRTVVESESGIIYEDESPEIEIASVARWESANEHDTLRLGKERADSRRDLYGHIPFRDLFSIDMIRWRQAGAITVRKKGKRLHVWLYDEYQDDWIIPYSSRFRKDFAQNTIGKPAICKA